MRKDRRTFGAWALISPFVGLYGCGESAATYKDKLAPGILLEDDKAVLPAGEALRDIHPRGLDLTERSEGWVPKLYNDTAGFCTIGYGHLAYKSRCDGKTPKEYLGGISKEDGRRLLVVDMALAQTAVQLAMPNHKDLLNDLQFSALCDFVFNVGAGNFNGSTLLKVVKDNNFKAVPAQLRRWVLADGKPYEGLRRRREGEIELFFEGVKEEPDPDEKTPAAERSQMDIRPKGT